MIHRDRILSVAIDRGEPEEMLAAILENARVREPGFVCFANVHMLYSANYRSDVRQALDSAFLVAPDGMPLARILGMRGFDQKRVDGMSVFPILLARAAQEEISVAFFGDDQATLDAVCAKAARDIPALHVVAAIAPRQSDLPFADNSRYVDQLVASGAGLIFVALGCPKQELWMAAQTNQIPAVLLGVGNAFQAWLGWEKRAPDWVRKICMEWAVRLCQDPKRLWKRYLVSNTWFVARVLPGAILKRLFAR